uniref:Myelin and lymphocyte protein n=1 Tax=Sus scrofa TaxID=9823 RepID=A0A8D2CHX3_PIG
MALGRSPGARPTFSDGCSPVAAARAPPSSSQARLLLIRARWLPGHWAPPSKRAVSAEPEPRASRCEADAQPASMAPSAVSGGSSLPSGFAVFITFPDLLFIFEFIFGGLVWILITWSQVPNPQVQGWVMFVSVFCFIATTLLLFLYVAGAHKTGTFWINLDAAYHCIAFLFYLSASIFEAFLTIWPDERNEDKQHIQNISAGSLFIVTLLYLIHAVFSLIRWKSF